MNNPIIDEVRAARAAIAAEHGYDRAKILAWARAQQAIREQNGTEQMPEGGNHATVLFPATKQRSTRSNLRPAKHTS